MQAIPGEIHARFSELIPGKNTVHIPRGILNRIPTVIPEQISGDFFEEFLQIQISEQISRRFSKENTKRIHGKS